MYIGFIIMLFMFPAQLSMTMTRWARKPIKVKRKKKDKNGTYHTKTYVTQPKLKPLEAIVCCLPYISAMKVWKSLYRSYGWTPFTSILSFIGVVFRVIVVFATRSELLFIISFWVFWASVLLLHLTYIITYVVLAHMYAMKWLVMLLCVVFPYGAAWYLNNTIPRIMREIREEEDDRFKGRA